VKGVIARPALQRKSEGRHHLSARKEGRIRFLSEPPTIAMSAARSRHFSGWWIMAAA